MFTRNIKLTTINNVKDFVDDVNKFDEDVDISVGNYVIDAKSIMGIFSLDLSRELSLTVHAPEETCERFDRIIGKYYI